MLSIRARLAIITGLAFAGLVLVVLVTRPAPDALDNPAYAAIVAAHSRRMAADALALDSARAALSAKTAVFYTHDTRYVKIRDSVFVPVSHTDTVEVLARLPQFIAASDSMHRACTDLVESCAVFRVRAESSLAGLTVDRDLWKGIAESEKPSKWEPVRQWAIRGLIAYGAFRLGQAAR